MEQANTVQYFLAVLVVSALGVFGLGTMFARASNIERNGLVGGATLFTVAVGIVILASVPSYAFTPAALVSTVLVSGLGYPVGRLLDRIAGPRDETADPLRPADLAD